jgi:hypothetical protein
MATSWWDRLLKRKSRPAPRVRRPAAVRPRVEALETRLVPAVFSGLVNGQLQVLDTSAVDTVTLDHSGTSTLVNGAAFSDAAITNGILIRVGTGVGNFDTVNILATVKPVTVDGQFDIGALNLGKNGSAQGVLAPVSVTHFNGDGDGKMTLNDSANPFSRNVTLDVVNGKGVITGLAPATITFEEDGIGTLTISGGSGGNAFTVLNTPNGGSFGLTTVNLKTGVGQDTVAVRRSADGSFLYIFGQNGRDTVHIGNAGSVQGIEGFVEVNNLGSFTDLFVDDSADAAHRDVTLDTRFTGDVLDPNHIRVRGLAPGEISYNVHDVSTATISAGGAGNTFVVEDFGRNPSGTLVTVLNTGTGGDLVRVEATRDALVINGQDGFDVVDIGSDSFPGGSMTGIVGNVLVTNTASFTSLSLNDAVDQVGRTVTLSATSTLGEVVGLSPGAIRYRPADISQININGGSAGDTFFVRSTAGPAPVQINALGGDDKFIVGSPSDTLDTIRSRLTLNGGSGFDSLTVNDQGSTTPHTYTLTATSLTRSSTADPTVTINFSGIDTLQLNEGPLTLPHPPLARDLALTDKVRVGEPATLTGRLWDEDAGDTLSLAADWGDGSPPETITPDRAPFALTHAYAAPGTYTVRVIWTDSSGESNFRDLTLRVGHAKQGGHAGPAGALGLGDSGAVGRPGGDRFFSAYGKAGDAGFLWFLGDDGDVDHQHHKSFSQRLGLLPQP